ncbi:DUF1330 domain-containing protein [Ruegeria sp. MALMAid1280]|uniref:DUF1330 domain-containing protein n=1 Tax=Ruegeria sp. MALMAid1280 TaxID=3411634 RepID=UPI003B9E90D0
MFRQVFSVLSLLFGSLVPVMASAEDAKGYIVGTVTIQNKDWIAEYRPKTAELLEKHGGKILVRGAPVETLEGKAPEANAILVVEFPSVESALAWYNDPEYAPLRDLRQTGSTVDWVLVEALNK